MRIGTSTRRLTTTRRATTRGRQWSWPPGPALSAGCCRRSPPGCSTWAPAPVSSPSFWPGTGTKRPPSTSPRPCSGGCRTRPGKQGLKIRTINADAGETPLEDFDAVVERHVLWTVPATRATLEAWHRSAPRGRLVLMESLWGDAGGLGGQLRRAGHDALRRWRRGEHAHHAEYSSEMLANFPLSGGVTPDQYVSLVESTSWGATSFERLRDVEWATRQALPSVVDRLVGVAPHFAVVAG